MKKTETRKLKLGDLVGIQFDETIGLNYGIIVERNFDNFKILFDDDVTQWIDWNMIKEFKGSCWRLISSALLSMIKNKRK